MKKRIVALLLTCVLVISGCASGEKNGGNENGTESSVTESSVAPESSAEESSAQESTAIEETAPTEEPEAEEGYVTTGGNPWIDSDLKENVTADMTLSPKDDFHLYVNHDWIMNAQIPEGHSSWGAFNVVADEIEAKALALLNDETLKGHDAELIQALYHAYLDWDSRNAAGVTPLMSTIEDIKGIKTMDELTDFICDMDRAYGVPTFLGGGNGTGLSDSSKYITYIVNDGLMLGDAAEYKERTEMGDRTYEAYVYLAKYMLPRVGYTEEEAVAMFDAMLDFEKKLAENAFTSADSMSPDYLSKVNNVRTLKELEEASPVFPIKRFIKAMGYDNAKEFLLIQPKVLDTVNEVYVEENLDAIKNYMIVKYVLGNMGALDREAYEANVNASNMVNGSEGSLPDEKLAFSIVRSALTTPMDRAYLEKYDSKEVKTRITNMIKEIISVYREMLSEEDWMSEATREKAIEKLDNMRINAIYPDKWLDYGKLELKGLSYLECLKAISEFNQELDHKNTNGKVDKDLWSVDTLETNAFYNPMDNSINIILGLLGGDFYHEGMSDEELYGGIGAVIGHEISHAFDTNGAQFDKNGNMASWWSMKDYTSFQKRARKLIDHYNTLTAWEGAQIMGNNCQTEAIADLAGLKAVLKLAEKKENFDYEKFFTAYATIWQEVITYETEYMIYSQDSHPLNYLRTNVTVQQFDEFYKTFDVKEGDNMYLAPEDRILVW